MRFSQAVYEHTQTLDKMLSAYAQIGNCLPWLSRLGSSFPEDLEFQRLFAFLYEDIMEFHLKAYALIRKPGEPSNGSLYAITS